MRNIDCSYFSFFSRLFITIYYCFLQPQTKDSIIKPKYRAIKQYPVFWLPACNCFYVLFSLLILINTKIRLYFAVVCPSGCCNIETWGDPPRGPWLTYMRTPKTRNRMRCVFDLLGTRLFGFPSWKSSDPKIIGIKSYLFENFSQKKGSSSNRYFPKIDVGCPWHLRIVFTSCWI